MPHRDIGPFDMGLEKADPEIAMALGVIFGEFGFGELTIVKICALLIGEHNPETPISHQIMGTIQSISLRLEILVGCAEKSPHIEGRRQLVRDAIAELRSINALRNLYVHAAYGTHHETGELFRETWFSSTTRNGEQEPVTASGIRNDIEKIKLARGRIARSLFPQDVETYQKPEASP
jgi:hypothetical protein